MGARLRTAGREDHEEGVPGGARRRRRGRSRAAATAGAVVEGGVLSARCHAGGEMEENKRHFACSVQVQPTGSSGAVQGRPERVFSFANLELEVTVVSSFLFGN